MEVSIFDSPAHIDRYTVVILRGDDNYDFYAMSARPEHPQGINMYCGSSLDGYFVGSHLGIRIFGVPECIKSAVELRCNPR